MRIHVLGSNGTYPSPGRPASGYLIEHGATRVWCDAGFGTFAALWETIDLESLSAVVVSHQHPDHCADLLAAFHAFAYGARQVTGLPLYAPTAVVESLTVFAGASGDPSEPFWRVFTHIPVAGGETHEIGDFTVTFASADHPVPTVASRWETAGKSFAFTADTGPAGDWMSVAAEVDLLLSEAALQGDRSDDMFAHHLTPAEAGAIARRMRARRLMLTHIPPHLDPTVSVAEAERTYDRAVALAVPGTVHDV